MAERLSVEAGWAIRSKRPGTRDDYSVLASSTGPLSAAEFGSVLAHFAPGNPTAEPDTPGSLPWVTLSRVGLEDRLYLGVSVQALTNDVDGTGRPISRTCYFCLPYDQLARNPVSYRGLRSALPEPGLLQDGGGLVRLDLDCLDPAELARSIRTFGELAIASTAAKLLSGPVTITGPDLPSVDDRLRFFDAIAALLPYGYRPYLTAATWSDSGAGDKFRIVFANRARDEASRVPWQSVPRVQVDGPARDYLEFLKRALETSKQDHLDDRPASRLELLIDYLSHEVEASKFERPELAVRSLYGFFQPVVVSEHADAGTAAPAEIRQVFAARREKELSAQRRDQLFAALVAVGDQQDLPLITQRLEEITNGNPRAMLTDISMVSRRQLWSGESGRLARGYLEYLNRLSLADELLALLMPPPESAEDAGGGLDALAQLIVEFAFDNPTGPAGYPRTQQKLAINPAAGAALLARLCAQWQPGTGRLGAAADWLAPVADQVVGPFVSALGDLFDSGVGLAPEPVDAAAIAGLHRDGGRLSVRYLLTAASYRERLGLVLPGFVSWLAATVVNQGALADEQQRFWRGVAREISPASSVEASWLDLALLVTDNDPRTLQAATYSQPHYSQRLAAVWRELATEHDHRIGGCRGVDLLLENALIGFLGRVPWRADQAQSLAVQSLVSALTAGGQRPRLVAVVRDARETLRQMPVGASPHQIAQACVRAQAEGLTADGAGEALAESGAVFDGARALAVLEALHAALAAANARDPSYEWPLLLFAMFTGGAFGERVSAEFPRRAAERFGEELEFRVMLLRRLVGSAAPDGSPAIRAALADYLDRNRQDLEALVKDARKRQSRGWKRGGVKDGQDSQNGGRSSQDDHAATAGPPGQGGQS